MTDPTMLTDTGAYAVSVGDYDGAIPFDYVVLTRTEWKELLNRIDADRKRTTELETGIKKVLTLLEAIEIINGRYDD